jgi:hypothetical protein
MFDTTPIGEMKRSEFAIFRNRDNWQERRPVCYIDLRDKRDRPIRGLEGLINSVQSDLSLSKR